MNEIDYGELDKEVSRVMSDTGGTSNNTIRKRMEAEEEGLEASEVHVNPRSGAGRRGRYMDMIHPASDMKRSAPVRNYSAGKNVKPIREPVVKARELAEVVPEEDESEFGVIEDVGRDLAAEEDFVSEPEAMLGLEELAELDERLEELNNEEPNANNYSLGGKSPFIPDAKVEKRPLGDYVPENSTRGVQSTRNVYSQRTPSEQPVPDVKPIVVATKKKSGWVWALVTILVILVGGGLGVLAFVLYNG